MLKSETVRFQSSQPLKMAGSMGSKCAALQSESREDAGPRSKATDAVGIRTSCNGRARWTQQPGRNVRTVVPILTIQADLSCGWLGSIPRAGVLAPDPPADRLTATAISPGRPGLTPAGHTKTICGQWG